MKYCSMPFEYLYLDHFNGSVCVCPWIEPSVGSIGNILEQDFDEIWNGERAEMLRDTVRKGTFDYCRSVACPYLQNDDLEEVDYDENDPHWKACETPKRINMAFDFICNQSCPTCRDAVFKPVENYVPTVNKIVEKIQPLLDKALYISASGHGDPFASPIMMKILENMHPSKDCNIYLETNGVFFDEEHWERIKHLADCKLELIVTTNSYYEPSYNHISRGGNLEKLKQNQRFMKKLRDEGKLVRIGNCLVIQERNFQEIPKFIETSLDEYGFDSVILRPVYNWGNLSEEDYWFKDVLNPLHPYHEEYAKIIELPIVKDNPRVYNFGGETAHKPKPMPGKSPVDLKNEGYFELFKKWLKLEKPDEKIAEYLTDNNMHKVYIYGAGDLGRAIARLLKGSKIDVLGFIDQFCCECSVEGLKVYRLDSCETCKDVPVIVTPPHVFAQLKEDISSAGFTKEIIPINDVLC